jgi:nicotinamide-nucleotide amidase
MQGTAPGMWMKKKILFFVSLPGVAYDDKYLVENGSSKVGGEYERHY